MSFISYKVQYILLITLLFKALLLSQFHAYKTEKRIGRCLKEYIAQRQRVCEIY